jgi:hypothetical protein
VLRGLLEKEYARFAFVPSEVDNIHQPGHDKGPHGPPHFGDLVVGENREVLRRVVVNRVQSAGNTANQLAS